MLDGEDRPSLIRHSSPEHANVVLVDWMLGNSCNFACSYCPSSLHDGSVRWQRRRRSRPSTTSSTRTMSTGLGRKVWLQFTGGEPTLYPGLMGILGGGASGASR